MKNRAVLLAGLVGALPLLLISVLVFALPGDTYPTTPKISKVQVLGVDKPMATTINFPAGTLSGNVLAVPAGAGLGDPVTYDHGGTGLTATPTNGQLLIGQTAMSPPYALGTLTAGTGITITNAAGSITPALANTAVTPASYTYAGFTVDQQGRLTAASSGAAPLPLAGGTMTGAITLSGTQLGTYSLGGTPTLAATLALGGQTLSGNATFSGAVTASGTASFDLSGGSGIFKTTTGAVTIGPGAVTISGKTTIQPAAATSGNATPIYIAAPANTGITASAEQTLFQFDMSATQTWATGDVAQTRAMRIKAPTYAFAGDSTVTDAPTVDIDRAPQAGAHATLVNPVALYVHAGVSRFDGAVNLAGGLTSALPVAYGGTGAATATANYIFAGPTTGSAAAPSFRALVAADVSGFAAPSCTGCTGVCETFVADTGGTTAQKVVVLSGAGKVQDAGATVNLTTVAGIATTTTAATGTASVCTFGRVTVNSSDANCTAGALASSSGLTAGSVQCTIAVGLGAGVGRISTAQSGSTATIAVNPF